jgi:hypothetical protein
VKKSGESIRSEKGHGGRSPPPAKDPRDFVAMTVNDIVPFGHAIPFGHDVAMAEEDLVTLTENCVQTCHREPLELFQGRGDLRLEQSDSS